MALEEMYPIVGTGGYGQLDDASITPEIVRSQIAGATGDTDALQRQILENQIRDRSITGVGAVPEMRAGMWDDPKTYAQLATLPVGGLAAGVGAGARGIAGFSARQAAVEGMKELGESIFAGTLKAPTGIERAARMALGVGATLSPVFATAADMSLAGATEQELARMGTDAAQAEIRRRFDERAQRYGDAQKAKQLANPAPLDRGQVYIDASNMDPAAFKAKYGMDMVDAMNKVDQRGISHPPGAYRRGY